jgi:hypothetical protein
MTAAGVWLSTNGLRHDLRRCCSHVGWMGLGGSAPISSWMSRTQGSSPTNCRAYGFRTSMSEACHQGLPQAQRNLP